MLGDAVEVVPVLEPEEDEEDGAAEEDVEEDGGDSDGVEEEEGEAP